MKKVRKIGSPACAASPVWYSHLYVRSQSMPPLCIYSVQISEVKYSFVPLKAIVGLQRKREPFV